MNRFEYCVTTKASPERAWEIFSDWHRWNHFADVYGQLIWREGRPWEPGSRLQIELLRPVNAMIEHVITTCVPAKKVGWIDHALGVAIGQWVTFEHRPSEGTRVHTWGDIVHSGEPIDSVQDYLGHRSMESRLVYARVSDGRRSKAISSSSGPGRSQFRPD